MRSIAGAGAAAVACVFWLTACAMPAGPVVHEHHEVERGAATNARVEIEMSFGELEVQPGATKLLEGDFDFNLPALKPAIEYEVNGGIGALRVSQDSASGNYENKWRLSLDAMTPVDLDVSLGAGDATLVLGRLNLRNLEINLGAGDLIVDLRGTPANSYKVRIDAGAGDTTIHLPPNVGISATTSGLIGDATVTGLEKRGGRWVNPRADASAVTLDLEVRHAVGDLRLLAE
jgi:hypothetical protein